MSFFQDIFTKRFFWKEEFHVSSFLFQEDQDSGLFSTTEVSTFDDTTTKCQTVIC